MPQPPSTRVPINHSLGNPPRPTTALFQASDTYPSSRTPYPPLQSSPNATVDLASLEDRLQGLWGEGVGVVGGRLGRSQRTGRGVAGREGVRQVGNGQMESQVGQRVKVVISCTLPLFFRLVCARVVTSRRQFWIKRTDRASIRSDYHKTDQVSKTNNRR